MLCLRFDLALLGNTQKRGGVLHEKTGYFMSLRCAAAYSQLLQAELTPQEQAASSALPVPRDSLSLEGQQCRWPALGTGEKCTTRLDVIPTGWSPRTLKKRYALHACLYKHLPQIHPREVTVGLVVFPPGGKKTGKIANGRV